MDHTSLSATLGYFRNPRELQRMQEKALVSL
jgi:hypothetical protein